MCVKHSFDPLCSSTTCWRFAADGDSSLDCDAAFSVAGSTIVLESLAVNGLVVCTGTFMLSADDVDNLERESGATVAAVDKYGYSVGAAATALVVLSQVVTRNVDSTIVNRRHQQYFPPSEGIRQTILGQVELISMPAVPCFKFVRVWHVRLE